MSCWALTVDGRVESVNELLGLDRLSRKEVESVNELLGLDRLRKS